MDKHSRLIALSEACRCWRVAAGELTRAELVFRAVWVLEAEVNNGGFDQYYFNASGDLAYTVVDALREIEADATARIVHEANTVFPEGDPPRRWIDRRTLMAQERFETARARLEDLDSRFYAHRDDLAGRLFAYVEAHVQDIEGARSLFG